jgi:hypothetical protein
LRDYPGLRTTAGLPADPAPIVIAQPDGTMALSERYSGAGFVLLEQWRPDSLEDSVGWLRWILYREAKTPPASQEIVLWADRLVGGRGFSAGRLDNPSLSPVQPQ